MSDREQALNIINAMPDYRVSALLALLRAFTEIPDMETHSDLFRT